MPVVVAAQAWWMRWCAFEWGGEGTMDRQWMADSVSRRDVVGCMLQLRLIP